MILIIPEKFLNLNQLNDWNFYQDGLSGSRLVKKYFEEIFKNWVRNLENPLIIPFIRQLFDGNFSKLEKQLEKIEKYAGEKNLFLLIEELPKKQGKRSEIIKKVYSINNELNAQSVLISKGFTNLIKISRVGDWENEDALFSVKSILDYDINLKIIGNTIQGLLYINEFRILHDYGNLHLLAEFSHLDDYFVNMALNFIEHSIPRTLDYIDYELIKTDYLEMNYFLFDGDDECNPRAKNCVKISAAPINSKNSIHLNITQERLNESNLPRSLKIIFNKSPFVLGKYSNIFFCSDAFWEGQTISDDFFKNRIGQSLNKFDREFRKNQGGKNFFGIIIFSLHPMHEKTLLSQLANLEENARKIKNLKDREYKVFLSFIPEFGFELKQPITIEI